MRLKSLFYIFFLMFIAQGNSQEFVLGVKGGINYNSIGQLFHLGADTGSGANVIPKESKNYDAEKEIGTQFGVFGSVKFSSFFVRTEINITKLKNNFPLAGKKSKYESSKIDIPILVAIEIKNPVSIYIGPVFNIISDTTLEGIQDPFLFEKKSISIATGVLINFRKFGIDIRYQYDVQKVAQQRLDFIRSVYGTNVAHLLEYNGSQILISAHINIININGSKKGRGGSGKNRWNSCF